jgi:hypothetical protein
MKEKLRIMVIILFGLGLLPLSKALCADNKVPEVEVDKGDEASVSSPVKPDKEKKKDIEKDKGPAKGKLDIKLILSDPLPLLNKEG